MKALLCLLLLFAGGLWADEPSDRQAIERVIVSLNESPPLPTLFTADSDARITLDLLRPWSDRRAHRPTVVISHEPWGEATISWAGACGPIVNRRVRFITPDVALADAGCVYDVNNAAALLFVMKKEGADWKIASLRRLAER